MSITIHIVIFAWIRMIVMMKRFWLLPVVALTLVSCKTNWALHQVQPHKNTSISADMKEDLAMKMVIDPYKESLEKQMSAKLSYTDVELTKSGDNSSLGNLLADYTYDAAMKWAKSNNHPTIDAALINIGGIRSTIGRGDILLKNVFEVMPFENELVIVKLSGSEMNDLFSYYVSNLKNNPVSRITIETKGGELLTALVDGKKVDPAKTYYIATSDYLAMGGDNMNFFKKGTMIMTGLKLRDLYVEEFKAHPTVVVPKDIRLTLQK